MLLLIYVLILTYFVFFSLMWDFLDSIRWGLDVYYYKEQEHHKTLLANAILLQLAFVLNGTIMILITVFLKFHLNLAFNNKTTIENLDKKNEPYISVYDIGTKSNWEQIFGLNKWLWPFPVFCGSGKPLGDGIYWPTNRNDDALRQGSTNAAGGQSSEKNNVARKTDNSQQSKAFN